MVKMNIKDLDSNITAEAMKELEAAEKMMPLFDEDSPEMIEDMLPQFKRMHQVSRVKKTASIRLSEKAQLFSKNYGKGYTSFLSRLIDAALDDENLVKKCF